HGGRGAALAAARHRGGLSLPAGAGRPVRRGQRSRPGAGWGAPPPAAPRPAQPRRAQLQRRRAPGDLPPRHLRVPRPRRLLVPRPLTFTFDVEDHRPDEQTELRMLHACPEVLAFCADRGVVGTVFVVGEVVRDYPDLVREIAAHGHELGLHGWRHTPITELPPDVFREETRRARELLAEVSGQEVLGFRAPTFSLVKTTVWATEVLAELGFRYSSSILPAWSPLYGFRGLPRRPFTWPSGLLELPAPIVKVGPLGLPVVGGTYLRVLPWPIVRLGMRD